MEILKSRENTILMYIAQGLSNPQMGQRLGISVHTVKGDVTKIINKLNATDRTNAVYLATKAGLL